MTLLKNIEKLVAEVAEAATLADVPLHDKMDALKLLQPTKELLEAHYADLKEKPFFPGLLKYMLSGPVVAIVIVGKNAVKTGRAMLGATNPADSAPGTIRFDFCIEVGMNVCHGSDSVENAEKEIQLWFPEGVVDYRLTIHSWVYEAK